MGHDLRNLVASLAATSVPAGVSLVVALAWTLKVTWVWTIVGALLLDVACLQTKQILQHPRPVTNPAHVLESEGLYGMPSEHAAFAAFILIRVGYRWVGARWSWGLLSKATAMSVLFGWAFILLVLRYQTGAHSISQLGVGIVVGMVAGIFWNRLESMLERPLQKAQAFIVSSALFVDIFYGDGKAHQD